MERSMRARGLIAGVLAAAIAVMAMASAASGQSASTPEKKLTFIIGSTNDIETVNPLRMLETPEYEVNGMEYDLLFHFRLDNMQAAPGLATELPTKENGGLSSDELTWTMHIRDDAKWSDGQPLTAHDIAFTYNVILTLGFSAFASYFPFVDSITAPDDTTLVWKTTKPTMSPLMPPNVYILPEHIWSPLMPTSLEELSGLEGEALEDAIAEDKTELRTFQNFPDPVTSGPFRMVEWNKSEDWTLEANKDYWGGAPTIDEVIVKVYKNAETMVQDLKQGAIDFAEDIPANLFGSLEGQPGITRNVGSAFGFSQMSFNMCDANDPNACPHCKSHPGTGNPALLDLNVRTAIAMAVDKQALVDRVGEGYGTPGTTVVPPGAAFWHWEPGADTIPFDIPGANQLLDQAGYTDTDGNGVRNDPNTGDDLELRFFLRSDSPSGTAMGKLIVGWVKQIGIQLMPVSYTDGKLIDAWYANDFDMYIWGWAPDPDPDYQLGTYTAGQCGSWSDTCYSNPEYNQLYEDQRSTIDPDERKAIVVQMQQIIYQQIPEIVLEYGNDLQAYRSDRWTGFVYQPSPDSRGWGGSILYQFPAYPKWSYLTIKPVSAEAGTVKASGIPTWVWGLAVGVILVIVAGVMLARRRQPEEEQA